MPIISDLHIHSRFSRACSNAITLPKLEQYAKIKGIDLLGTGDFTHPKWFEEIKKTLHERDGILYSQSRFPFLLTGEISLIYTHEKKGRRVHYLLLAPSLGVVKQIHEALLKKGRIDYDGRPIFGFSSPELVDLMRSISEEIEIIPAHVWTPHFAIFGSLSGFDSVEECFGEKAKHIHALETGMSSDPEMNWRVSHLDRYNLVSFSDSHSFWPYRLGREATIFELEKLTYQNIIAAIRDNGLENGFGKNRIIQTIETDPAYGKYHFDGHRSCNIVSSPEETSKHKGVCPVCRKQLTLGVAYRVEQLADRPLGFVKKNAIPFKSLIPLQEIIAGVYQTSVGSKTTQENYDKLIQLGGSENSILLNVSKEVLIRSVHSKLAEAIIKSRNRQIEIKPGYDGVYGKPLFDKEEQTKKEAKETPAKKKQKSLADF